MTIKKLKRKDDPVKDISGGAGDLIVSGKLSHNLAPTTENAQSPFGF